MGKPVSLFRFLASHGGIRDDRGELAAMNLTRGLAGDVLAPAPLEMRRSDLTAFALDLTAEIAARPLPNFQIPNSTSERRI